MAEETKKTKEKTQKESPKEVNEVKSEDKQTKPKENKGFAVIRTGGKQYIVKPGLKIQVEKLDKKEGEKVLFEEVLLKETVGNIELGNPVTGGKVEGKVLRDFRDKKVIVFKYKKRKNYRRKQGHRQNLTEVEITNI